MKVGLLIDHAGHMFLAPMNLNTYPVSSLKQTLQTVISILVMKLSTCKTKNEQIKKKCEKELALLVCKAIVV